VKEEEALPAPKKTRTRNPLNIKSIKPTLVKDLDEFNTPSLGTELIQSLNSEQKHEEVVSIIPEVIVEENVTEAIPEPKEEPQVNQYAGFIKDGVEVVDVKLILKDKEKKVDKFGIPILPGEHKNFDRI
jgi:hypothetical protein